MTHIHDTLMAIHLHIISILTYFVLVLNLLNKKSTNIFSIASLLHFYKMMSLLTLSLPRSDLVILISGCYPFYCALRFYVILGLYQYSIYCLI